MKRKTKTETYLWLDRTVARAAPFVTLVRTEEDFLHAVRHCKVQQPEKWVHGEGCAAVHCFEHATDGLCCIVAIHVTTQTPIEIAAILVHEAVHVVQHYFTSISERYPAIEQQAYAIQYMSQTLMTEYLRQINQEFPQ
jgi:hypothetical protein